MIKLIASDIDGTLVHDGSHELNPELYDVILKLKEKGIQFAAASGRQWCRSRRGSSIFLTTGPMWDAMDGTCF